MLLVLAFETASISGTPHHFIARYTAYTLRKDACSAGAEDHIDLRALGRKGEPRATVN